MREVRVWWVVVEPGAEGRFGVRFSKFMHCFAPHCKPPQKGRRRCIVKLVVYRDTEPGEVGEQAILPSAVTFVFLTW